MTYRSYLCVIVLCFISFIPELIHGLSSHASRACIVGGGFAGLATARHMKDYGVNFQLFEANKEIGGTWRFDPHVGVDEDGLPLFTSMYKNLRTNTPRHTMEFSGFPFPEDTPSFPSGACYFKYLKLFVKNFDLNEYIQVRSLVTSVKWAEDHWDVSYIKTDTKERHRVSCDFMVIATGRYNAPKWPKVEGMDIFEGNMIHSHDYKEPEPYTNHRVLVVGAGASGLDIATHLINVTSKLVHSHHFVYNQPKFADSYVKKPDIKAFTPTGAIFQDGTFEEIDDIIFCTGYNYNLPFLAEDAGLTVTGKVVLPLYQQLVNINHPSMLFPGISKQIINSVLDAQGEYAAALASGKFKLPSQETMLKSWGYHVCGIESRGKNITEVNVVGDLDEYYNKLTEEAGLIRAPPVIIRIRNFSNANRVRDLLNYRDYDYKIIDDYNYERWYNPRKGFPCPIEI